MYFIGSIAKAIIYLLVFQNPFSGPEILLKHLQTPSLNAQNVSQIGMTPRVYVEYCSWWNVHGAQGKVRPVAVLFVHGVFSQLFRKHSTPSPS